MLPHQKCRRTVVPLCLVAVVSFVGSSLARGDAREDFYRQRKTLSCGQIVFSSISIYTIALTQSKSDLKKNVLDEVDSLKLQEGTKITIYRDASRQGEPLLTGTVGPGTPDDSAATLRGRFYWAGTKLDKLVLSRMKLRLKNVTLNAALLKGTIRIPRDETVFLSQLSGLTLAADSSSGQYRLVVPSASLKEVQLTWGELNIAGDFGASGLSLDLDISTNSVQIRDGALLRDRIDSGVPSKTISQFVPEHLVGAGSISFSSMKIAFNDTGGSISAKRASIASPELAYQPFPSLKVAGAAELVMTQLGTSDCQLAGTSFTCSAPASPQVIVRPNPPAVIERLNRFGLVEPQDYLLPTGQPGIKYLSLTGLHKVLAGPDGQQTRNIARYSVPPSRIGPMLTVQNGVAMPMTEQEIFDYVHHLPPMTPEQRKQLDEMVMGICMPGSAFAKEAGALTEVIVKMLVGSPTSAGTAAALRATTALYRNGTAVNPRYTEAAFKLAYHSTAAIKEVAGQAADKLVEYVYSATTNKLWQIHQELSQLAGSYQTSALPATLRYSQRVEEWRPWQAEEQAKLNGTMQQQKQQSSAASSQNDKNNQQTTADSREREKQVKGAVKDALNNPITPPADGSSGTTQPPSDTGSGTAGRGGNGTSKDCNGVLPDGTVVICTKPPYPNPDTQNKVEVPKP